MGLDQFIIVENEGCKEEFASFRKVNALQGYMERNYNVENTIFFPLTIEIIEEIIQVVNEVINDPSLAESNFPTCSGFFYGSLEYDEYYYSSLKDIKCEFERLHNSFSQYDKAYYYCWY